MKGGSLPAATFRGAYHHHSDKERTQEPDDADKQHPHRHNHRQQWVPVYSLVMTALVMGLVVPITEHAHPVAGATLALILALVSVILVYRFVAGVRTSTMTDWEYVRMPGALACLDIYLFVCLNWAMIWFVIWATDKDGALSAAAEYSDSTAAHLVYLVILYNVLASFWFSGGGRLYPASPLAYTWGFLSLVIGAWLAILVAGWLVHIVRRSPSRVNENTLLPVYHTPYPAPGASAFSGMGSAMTGAAAAAAMATATGMTASTTTTNTRNATPTPTLQEQEELRKTMMRLAQAQKEQRLLQQRAAEAANKAKNPAPSVSPIPLLQQQQQQPQQQQRGGIGEKSTKAKDI